MSEVKVEWREKDNKERTEKGTGGRRGEEVISPLTESSRRQKEPQWGEMDGCVTDSIE